MRTVLLAAVLLLCAQGAIAQKNTAAPCPDALAPVQLDSLWGYLNLQGKMVVPAIYTDVFPFSEGLGRVKTEDAQEGIIKMGFVDATGKVVLPLKYDNAESFSDGVAPVQQDGEWFFITPKGNQVFGVSFEDAFPFSEGLARVKMNGLWGFIDRKGEVAIQYQFEKVSGFKNGVAWVTVYEQTPEETTEKVGLIDRKGNYILQPSLAQGDDFSCPTHNTARN